MALVPLRDVLAGGGTTPSASRPAVGQPSGVGGGGGGSSDLLRSWAPIAMGMRGAASMAGMSEPWLGGDIGGDVRGLLGGLGSAATIPLSAGGPGSTASRAAGVTRDVLNAGRYLALSPTARSVIPGLDAVDPGLFGGGAGLIGLGLRLSGDQPTGQKAFGSAGDLISTLNALSRSPTATSIVPALGSLNSLTLPGTAVPLLGAAGTALSAGSALWDLARGDFTPATASSLISTLTGAGGLAAGSAATGAAAAGGATAAGATAAGAAAAAPFAAAGAVLAIPLIAGMLWGDKVSKQDKQWMGRNEDARDIYQYIVSGLHGARTDDEVQRFLQSKVPAGHGAADATVGDVVRSLAEWNLQGDLSSMNLWAPNPQFGPLVPFLDDRGFKGLGVEPRELTTYLGPIQDRYGGQEVWGPLLSAMSTGVAQRYPEYVSRAMAPVSGDDQALKFFGITDRLNPMTEGVDFVRSRDPSGALRITMSDAESASKSMMGPLFALFSARAAGHLPPSPEELAAEAAHPMAGVGAGAGFDAGDAGGGGWGPGIKMERVPGVGPPTTEYINYLPGETEKAWQARMNQVVQQHGAPEYRWVVDKDFDWSKVPLPSVGGDVGVGSMHHGGPVRHPDMALYHDGGDVRPSVVPSYHMGGEAMEMPLQPGADEDMDGRENVPAMLEAEEYVIAAPMAERYAPLLEAINMNADPAEVAAIAACLAHDGRN